MSVQPASVFSSVNFGDKRDFRTTMLISTMKSLLVDTLQELLSISPCLESVFSFSTNLGLLSRL